MKKLKHNKKRNTAFLFETLVREVTKCAVNQDKPTQAKILNILKEFFNKNSLLNKELRLYKTLLETKGIDKTTAEKILSRTQVQYSQLNKESIFETQSRLIKKINLTLGQDVYSNFVPNYKYVATTHQVLSGELKPKDHVMLENALVDYMCSAGEKRNEQKNDKLVFKAFLERFNQTYGPQLNEDQKKFIRLYLNSINDNGLEFKIYLQEETQRLEAVVSNAAQKDNKLQDKLNNVLSLVETLKKKEFDDQTMMKILQIQELAAGLSNED